MLIAYRVLATIFILMAILAMVSFINDGQPFKIWAWPMNAAIWCAGAVINTFR